jgi:hypothetical protein
MVTVSFNYLTTRKRRNNNEKAKDKYYLYIHSLPTTIHSFCSENNFIRKRSFLKILK